MNDVEFGPLKFWKLRYERGEIIQPFYRIGFPKILSLSCLICEKFEKLSKTLLNHVEYIH